MNTCYYELRRQDIREGVQTNPLGYGSCWYRRSKAAVTRFLNTYTADPSPDFHVLKIEPMVGGFNGISIPLVVHSCMGKEWLAGQKF